MTEPYLFPHNVYDVHPHPGNITTQHPQHQPAHMLFPPFFTGRRMDSFPTNASLVVAFNPGYICAQDPYGSYKNCPEAAKDPVDCHKCNTRFVDVIPIHTGYRDMLAGNGLENSLLCAEELKPRHGAKRFYGGFFGYPLVVDCEEFGVSWHKYNVNGIEISIQGGNYCRWAEKQGYDWLYDDTRINFQGEIKNGSTDCVHSRIGDGDWFGATCWFSSEIVESPSAQGNTADHAKE